jgi:hypothetical protein
MHTQFTRTPVRVSFALLLFAVGCSGSSGSGKGDGDRKPGEKADQEKPQTGTVKGQVTYKGESLPGGAVTFVTGSSDKGKAFTGLVRADGTYELKDIPVGEVRVAVITEPAQPFPRPPASKPPKDARKPAEEGRAPRHINIPAKYANPDTSGIIYRVIGGSQEFNIQLLD